MIFFAYQSSIICLYAGRILSATVNIFELGAIFPLMRFRRWLIWRKGCSSVIFLAGKTSGNSEMKSGVSEVVIAENLELFPFLQVRVIPVLGNEMMEFPQSIIALWVVRYGIPRNRS